MNAPAGNRPGHLSTAALGLIVSIVVGVTDCRTESRAQAGRNTPGLANITYYSDAQGVFTMTPPPDTTLHAVTLRGSCSLPEIMLQVVKKGSGLPVRNATFRLGGRTGFTIAYLFKDGVGDYEISIFGKKTLAARNLGGLCSFAVRSTSEMPADIKGLYINDKVLAYVNRVMGKTVGSGECWDLVQEALDLNGADWARPFNFGRPLDLESDRINPGDIIQFKSVRLTSSLPGGGSKFQNIGAPDHTAVITGVQGKNRYELAQQNSDGKRYVTRSMVDLNNMKSGKYRIFRPVAGITK